MLEMEVLVAPELEARVVVEAERVERFLALAVEVARVLLEAVVRREVHAAAKPPDVRGRKEPHVEVHRGAIGIERVQHQRDAHRLPGLPCKLGTRGGRRRRQLASFDMREVHPAALEDIPVLDHLRDAAAAFVALPFVGFEGLAVEALQGSDDLFLQLDEMIVDGLGKHG